MRTGKGRRVDEGRAAGNGINAEPSVGPAADREGSGEGVAKGQAEVGIAVDRAGEERGG
jgi:hypothetical protein